MIRFSTHRATHKAVCVAPLPTRPKALVSPEFQLRLKSIETGIEALRRVMHDEQQVLSEFYALDSVLEDDGSFRHFAQLGGVDVLLGAFRQHQKNAKICMVGIELVDRLSEIVEIETMIVARGGLDLLFGVLRNHQTNADVNENVCRALANLSINTDNKVTIVARGGLELIIAALRNHPNHLGVNYASCMLLANIAASQRAAIAQSGAFAVVQAIMGRFPGDEEIQTQCRRFFDSV